MDAQSFYIILIIVGSLVSLALTVNAFFLKQMVESLNQVKIQTAILIEKSENKENRLLQLEKEHAQYREKLHEFDTHIHQLKNVHIFNKQ